MGIETLREDIAELDREIMDLIGKRIAVAKKIGTWKNVHGKPIRDVRVEAEVIERYIGMGDKHSISARTSKEVAQALIREAVDVQAALPRRAVGKRILIIGGNGKMGMWLNRFLSDNGHEVEPLDVGGPSVTEAIKGKDVVIISTPISTVGGILEELVSTGTDSLVFDISSLKSPFMNKLKDMAQNMKVCSLHPMFGPNIPSLYDRNILICDCGDTEAMKTAMELFDGHGANMIRLPLDQHDRRMSYVLGMSHAINIAFSTSLADSGLSYKELKEVGSTTFRKMIEGSEEVARENPLLYYEIQNLNDNAEVTWARFMEAVDKVKEASLTDSPESFVKIMEKGRVYFEGQSR